MLGAQQDVDGAGAPVDGPGRGKRHDVEMAPQPEVHGDFENGAARAGAVAFAVNDTHAADPGRPRVLEELRQLIARGSLGEAVQVEFVFDGNESPAQAANHLSAHAATLEQQQVGSPRSSRIDMSSPLPTVRSPSVA